MMGTIASTGRRGRTTLIRIGLVPPLAAALCLLCAGPASAHAVGNGVTASNYQTNVLSISPAVPGLEVRAVDVGNQLQLTNRSGQQITVLGYEQEPYLRIGPGGVDENQRSPSTFSNRSSAAPQLRWLACSQLPSGLDPTLTRIAMDTTHGLGIGMAGAALLGRQPRIPA